MIEPGSTVEQLEATSPSEGGEPSESPMPRFRQDPVRVTVGWIQTVVFTVIFGHLGIFAVVGLYYLLFEVYHPFTVAWHHVVSDRYWRHLIRSVGEYFLGTLLAMLVLWNPFKWLRREARPPTALDRLELRLHIPNLHQKERVSAWQFVLSPLVALIYAIPGFLLGAGLVWLLHKGLHAGRLYPILSQHPSFVAKLYTQQTDQHVVGILAGLVIGRRPMRKVFQDIQHFFAERRVARGRPGRWWDPLAYRVLVDYIAATQGRSGAAQAQAGRGTWVRAVMIGSAILLLALAGFGVHVLRDIATK